jgi:hypothetical protein
MYGGKEDCISNSGEKPEGNKPLKAPDINENVILKWIIEKQAGMQRT